MHLCLVTLHVFKFEWSTGQGKQERKHTGKHNDENLQLLSFLPISCCELMLQCGVIDLYFVLTLVCDSLIVSANCMVCTTTEFGKQVEGTENHTRPCRCTVCAVLCFCVPCCVSVCCAVLRAVFLCSLPPHRSPTTMPPTPPFSLHVGSVYFLCMCVCVCVCVCFFFLFFPPTPPPPPASVCSQWHK